MSQSVLDGFKSINSAVNILKSKQLFHHVQIKKMSQFRMKTYYTKDKKNRPVIFNFPDKNILLYIRY